MSASCGTMNIPLKIGTSEPLQFRARLLIGLQGEFWKLTALLNQHCRFGRNATWKLLRSSPRNLAKNNHEHNRIRGDETRRPDYEIRVFRKPCIRELRPEQQYRCHER